MDRKFVKGKSRKTKEPISNWETHWKMSVAETDENELIFNTNKQAREVLS